MIFNIQGDYRVDCFQDGKALLEAAQKGTAYDLLFCDIYMKEENGIEVAQKLLALSPKTAVVFFTTSREHAVDAFSLEALHYLVKPVSQEDIAEVFRRFGNGKRIYRCSSASLHWISATSTVCPPFD